MRAEHLVGLIRRSFHDAEEEIADSQSPRLSPYAVESQPIVRLEQGEQE